MRIATATIVGVSPMCQCRPISTKKPRDLTHEQFEEQVWRERCHVDEKGICFIPPMAFKNCLSEAAKYKGIQIPGKGKERYTKHFEAGVLCTEPVSLKIKAADVEEYPLFVPGDGKRGGSKRVWKSFPIFRRWGGDVQFIVLDELIDNEVFAAHLRDAGQYIGIGSFRPRNNGYFGRFEVKAITWA